jgi:phospholipase C
MVRIDFVRVVLSLSLAGISLAFTGCGAGLGRETTQTSASSSSEGLSAAQHIIFMSQENRSFDHYFAKLNDYRAARGLPRDADDLPANASNPDPNGVPIAAFHLRTMCVEPPSPSWGGSHIAFNASNPASNTPTMDGFVISAAGTALYANLNDTRGVRAMGYFTDQDLPYYYFVATQFATSDRFFASVPGETPPNRAYMMAATSMGYVHDPRTSLSAKTIFHLLEEKGISWKVYQSDATGSPGDAEVSITGSFLGYFQPFANQHQAKMVPLSQFFTDLQNNTLPAVAMIEPGWSAGEDEHPGVGMNPQVGVLAVSRIISALRASSSWKNSIFLLTWDEGGGFYDHVAPPNNVPNPDGIAPRDLFSDEPAGDFTRYGFRVPLLVVSPFAKPHYISHTPADFTAVLKLIETRFGLLPLTRRDANETDMLEYFDFVNSPNLNAPAPPVQPTNGACYRGLP